MIEPLPPYSLRVVSASDKGQVRPLNEDHYAVCMRPPHHEGNVALFVVADGMGGHRAGEVASQLAVNIIVQILHWLIDIPDVNDLDPLVHVRPILSTPPLIYPAPTYFERQLEYAIQSANQEIRLHTNSFDDVGGMGTTVTAALLVERELIIGHVGDSRAYLCRQGELQLLTQDHSYVAELIRLGQLDHSESENHPGRHLITRSLGHEKEVEVDIFTYDLELNDRLLLCTDGLWDIVGDSAEIRHQLTQYPIEIALQNLLDLANEKGGDDNITLIIAELVSA